MRVEPPGAVFSTIILLFFLSFSYKKKKRKGRKLHDYHHKIKSLWLRIPTRKHKHTHTHAHRHARTQTHTSTQTYARFYNCSPTELAHAAAVKSKISKNYTIKQSWALLRLRVLHSVIIAYITHQAESWGHYLYPRLSSLLCPFTSLCFPVLLPLWICKEKRKGPDETYPEHWKPAILIISQRRTMWCIMNIFF